MYYTPRSRSLAARPKFRVQEFSTDLFGLLGRMGLIDLDCHRVFRTRHGSRKSGATEVAPRKKWLGLL